MRIAPLGKTLLEHLFLITEIYIPGNSITHCLRVTLQRIVTFARKMVAKEVITKRRTYLPIGIELGYIVFGQTSMKVCIDILQNLRIRSRYIARNVEIVIVTFNLLHRHKARIMRHIALCLPHIDNAPNILLSQTILSSIFDISTFGIDHKHSLTPCCFRLFYNDDTSRNTCTIKKVGRESYDALDIPFFGNEIFTNLSLGIASKKDAMRQNAGGTAGLFQRAYDMEEESIIAILFRRNTYFNAFAPTMVFIFELCTLQPRLC